MSKFLQPLKPTTIQECQPGQVVFRQGGPGGFGLAILVKTDADSAYFLRLNDGCPEVANASGRTSLLVLDAETVFHVDYGSGTPVRGASSMAGTSYVYYKNDRPTLAVKSSDFDGDLMHIDIGTWRVVDRGQVLAAFPNWSVWSICPEGPMSRELIFTSAFQGQ